MGFLVKVLRFLVSSVLLTAVFAGCANIESKRRSAEFIGQMDLADFETFQCMDSVFIGSDFRESQIQELRALSHEVLSEALIASGYQAVAADGDLCVRASWTKRLSYYPGLFDPVDGPSAALRRRSHSKSSVAVRVSLTVEVYECGTDRLFWHAKLPNIFAAIQYDERRVSRSLQRAMQNFPPRNGSLVK